MKRFYLLCQGRVQGVGFRSFVQMQALNFDCTGWIRNLENGNVELEIQGEENSINHLLKVIREGNMFIKLDEYFIKEIPVKKEEHRFHIH